MGIKGWFKVLMMILIALLLGFVMSPIIKFFSFIIGFFIGLSFAYLIVCWVCDRFNILR